LEKVAARNGVDGVVRWLHVISACRVL
jgi:hypothetical protein